MTLLIALTLGVIDPTVTETQICTQSTKARRNVTAATKLAVCRRDGHPDCRGLIVDHIVPLETGGANVIGNLRAQRPVDSHAKDLEENAWHRKVCAGKATMKEAQDYFLRKYGGGQRK